MNLEKDQALVVFQEQVDSQSKRIPYHLDVFLERGIFPEKVGTFYQTKGPIATRNIAKSVSRFANERGINSLVISPYNSKGEKLSCCNLPNEIRKEIMRISSLDTRLQNLSFKPSPNFLKEIQDSPFLFPEDVVLLMELDPFSPVFFNTRKEYIGRFTEDLRVLGYDSTSYQCNLLLDELDGRHVLGVLPNAS